MLVSSRLVRYTFLTWANLLSSASQRCDDPFNKPLPAKGLGNETPLAAHLVGIAGTGMQALAKVLLKRGWRLTGSDLAPDAAAWLRNRGIRIHQGHHRDHVPGDAQLLIYSDAVDADTPERQRAEELLLAQRSYPQMLGELMTGRMGLAIAGTHGKSTTTAMAGTILVEAGLDPTVIGGGAPLGRSTGGRNGAGSAVVVEACEYRANFRHLRPQMAVIQSIEPDHFDFYRSRKQLEQAFADFLGQVPSDGLVLALADCPATRRVAAARAGRVATFGLRPGADWWAGELKQRRGRYRFRIFHGGLELCAVTLRVPGRHNVVNALAAAALAWEAGASGPEIRRSLGAFAGLRRRIEVVGEIQGIALVDDYAHHPTEITAALTTVRQMYPGRRVWCVFQPHQVSRTRHLLDEFAASLHNADQVAVAEVYRAREPSHQGPLEVSAGDLARRVEQRGGRVLRDVHALNDILEEWSGAVAPGDVLLTLGAGDIGKLCHGFADRLRRHRAAG